MHWDEYAQRFRAAAVDAGRDPAYVEQCLSYAERLVRRKVPIVYDDEHLAALLGYDLDYVLGAVHATPRFYRTFSVRKHNGGRRSISEPLPSLKEIQYWILRNILSQLKPSRFAKGFVEGFSIKDNARFHRRQPRVLSLDLKDFFPTVRRPRVYGIFRSFGYSASVSWLFSRLCTLDEVLPQGAPTSPALSNAVASTLDGRLGGFARSWNLRYTRYADDITFSGSFKPGAVIRFVRKVVAEEGFELNEEKTRLMGRHERQEVTGIVVNEGMRAPRDVRRRIRQVAYFVERYGLSGHLDHIDDRRAHYSQHILGVANHVRFVHEADRDALRLFELLRPVSLSEKRAR